MRQARWYFDFVSPYAYISVQLVDRLPLSLAVTPTPILFAALLDHWGTVGPAEVAPKRLHTYRQVTWLARRHGLPFRFPPAHPFNPLNALRLAIAAGGTLAVVRTLFHGIWGEGLDPSDPAACATLAQRVGIEDPAAALADPAVKQRLRSNTEAAIAAGVFGVPTWEADGELFWGVDSFPMFQDYLCDGALFEEEQMARYPTLPVGAARKR
jgi:2-hydroxychromene-2-carboxylate isomerase